MSEVLLLNPRKRRTHKRRANPESRAKRSRAAKLGARRRKSGAYASNPIGSHRRRVHRRVRSHRGHYRRNPIRGMGGIGTEMMDALIGAGGALTLDVIMGKLPLSDSLKTGIAGSAVKAVGAIGLGMLMGAIGQKKLAGRVAGGALTVVFHDALKTQLQTSVPSLTLGDTAIPYYPAPASTQSLGYNSPGMPTEYGMGEYVSGMGEYVSQY